MKRLPILRSLVQLLFVLCMIGVFFGLPLTLIVIVAPKRIPFDFFGHTIEANNLEVFFLMLAVYLGHCAFTYGIYLLKRTLTLFSKRKFFDPFVIIWTDQLGKAFIAAGMLWIIPPFFYNFLADTRLSDSVSGFGIPFFSICLGFLFMVLSEVFLMAKKIKEENDFTI